MDKTIKNEIISIFVIDYEEFYKGFRNNIF